MSVRIWSQIGTGRIDYTYYFTEYYKIWEAKALKMETVDERWQWLEKKQTLHDAQTVWSHYCDVLNLTPKINTTHIVYKTLQLVA